MKIDNLEGLFTEFWYIKPDSLKVYNDSRTLKSFLKRLATCKDTLELDDFIVESKTRRETMRKIAVEFYRFLREMNFNIESVLDTKRFYDYPFERQLEIAKYLHEKHTTGQIRDHFDIDERTVRQDLAELRDGIEVLGNTIQIKEEKQGRMKYYRTTLHPVFLPLNLTEVYALTVYMPRVMDRKNPNSKIICDISDRIKAQLSDYAINRLFPDEGRIGHMPPDLRYYDDEELARSRNGILMYLMKSGEPCCFYFDGKMQRARIDYADNRYYVISETGEKLNVNPEELEFVINSLDYR